MTQGPEKVALSKWQFTKTANKILGRNELAGRSKERVKRSINIRIISLCHQLSNKIIVNFEGIFSFTWISDFKKCQWCHLLNFWTIDVCKDMF